MKRYLIPFVVILGFLMTACQTSRTTVSRNADLSAYKYVSVVNNDSYRIPPELMDKQIQLFDAVEESGLTLVGDMRILDLTPEQQSRLLLVKYSVDRVNGDPNGVTVNFYDFMTGRPVVSCHGSSSTITMSRDTYYDNVLRNLASQIASAFGRGR